MYKIFVIVFYLNEILIYVQHTMESGILSNYIGKNN